jgi:hypothetical protein
MSLLLQSAESIKHRERLEQFYFYLASVSSLKHKRIYRNKADHYAKFMYNKA